MMPTWLKKILRTGTLTLLLVGVWFLVLSMIFPKTRPFFDGIRLYVQKHIITAISDFRYRCQLGEEVNLTKILSPKRLFPGDILFTAEESSLGSAFIEGKWKHMLVYLWTPRELQALLGKDSAFLKKIQSLNFGEHTALMIESSFEGVQVLPFHLLEPREAFAAFRLEIPKKVKGRGLAILEHQLWKPYDFDFDLENNEKLYCSELLYPVFLERGLSPKTQKEMRRTIISPDAMLASLLDPQLPKRMVHFLFYVESEYGIPRFMSKEQLSLTLN